MNGCNVFSAHPLLCLCVPSVCRLAALGLQRQALAQPLSVIPEAASPLGSHWQRRLPGGICSPVPEHNEAGTPTPTTSIWDLPPLPDERGVNEHSSDGSGSGAQMTGRMGRQARQAVRASPVITAEVTTSSPPPRPPLSSSLAPLLPAAWRSIRKAVPQLQAMLRQTRVSMALVMVMSAISLEAGDVWEAKRGLKRRQPQVPEQGNSEGATNTNATELTQEYVARAASLVRHVASLRELFASSPSGLPQEAAVMGLLSELRVARIQATAREVLRVRQRRLQGPAIASATAPNSNKELVGASLRSALGLPSLMLRKRRAAARSVGPDDPSAEACPLPGEEPSTDGKDELGAAGAPSAAAAATLAQLESRAQRYSLGFEALAASRLAARRQQRSAAATAVSGPAGIPALPSRRPKGGMKARRQAQAHVDCEMWKKSLQSLA